MASGASGGFLASYPLNLVSGESISIVVGTGGPAGPYETSQGGQTVFGTYLSCTGGFGFQGQGNCGSNGGLGFVGNYVVTPGGVLTGGNTPLVFGSGGAVGRCNGCAGSYPTIGSPGAPGAVIVDVLY